MPFDGVLTAEIVLGRNGIWGVRNGAQIPLGAARKLRNATVEDGTFRTMPGATKLGDAIGALTIQAAIDFWADVNTQRTLVSLSDGSLRKDDGAGASWATLASGLTTAGQVPFWKIGGAESVGRSRKAFHVDRVNGVRVLAADGASMTAISRPRAEWSGTNQPGWLEVHRGFLWAGGNGNDPHFAYRAPQQDHEDFSTAPYQRPVYPGVGERTVAALSFNGVLLIWKFPEGVFAFDTRSDSEATWDTVRVGEAGCVGPWNVLHIETDQEDLVVWVSPQGTLHALSPSDALGGVRPREISAARLGAFFRDNANLAQLATAQWAWYSQRRQALLACHGQGQSNKNRRLDLDVARVAELGERWAFQDRDRNEALFIRKKSGVGIPALGDAAGQLWELDTVNRNQDGTGYQFEWEIWDSDFAQLIPEARGRKTSGRFLKVLYDPRSTATHVIDVLRDGSVKQSLSFALEGGPTALPQTLPFDLQEAVPTFTRARRLEGQAYRWGFKGRSTGVNEDVSLISLMVGLEVAG